MSPTEWLLLAVLSVLWGGAFVLNEIVIVELPPITGVLGRVALAAVALSLTVRLGGYRMPRDPRRWIDFALIGAMNTSIPFSLILWGQIQIDAGLASILIAMTPLFTVFLAHLLTRDERLTGKRAWGVVIGLAGVSVTIGPDALEGLGLQVVAQLACLGAALCYACAGIFGRRFGGIPPLVAATGQITTTAAILVPVALIVDRPWSLPMPALETWGALVGLGLLSTAAAYVIYYRLLTAAGATNMTLVGYLIPVSAVLLGIAVLGESLEPRHVAGMALIGLGLAVTDGRPLARLRAHALAED
jgi:drug/metabolite transporter (DMT)-like permease